MVAPERVGVEVETTHKGEPPSATNTRKAVVARERVVRRGGTELPHRAKTRQHQYFYYYCYY